VQNPDALDPDDKNDEKPEKQSREYDEVTKVTYLDGKPKEIFIRKGKLEVVDLIVSKGQANVYALHDREKEILKPMFCLLRTQCDPIAEAFGAKGRVTVLKVWK
jgi:uncharacterized protein with ATP-grasp and redox domains